MNASKAKIGDIFQNSRLLVIPYFQRSYVWKEQDWENFTKSVDYLQENAAPYFFGSIILKKDEHGKDVSEQHIVIDGQQRITTMVLFMKALSLKAGKGPDFKFQFVLDNPTFTPVVKHNKHDKAAFMEILKAETPKAQINSKGNIVNAYRYFEKYIEDKCPTPFSASELWRAMMYYITFVKIELDQDDDEQKIFDTINSLGVELTTGELLKNYFFDEKNETIYDKKWSPVFDLTTEDNAYWTGELTKGRIKDNNTELFFYAYLQIKMQDRSIGISTEDRKKYRHRDKSMFDNYKEMIKKYDLNKDEIIDEVIEYATIYKNNFNIDVLDNGLSATPSFKRISALMYATRSMTMVPYCLYILKNVTDIAEQQRIFDYLEKYMMRRFVCGSKNNNYSDLFSENLIGQNKNSYIELKDYIEAKPYSDNLAMPTDADIDNAVANLSAGQNTQTVLYMLESKLNSLAATGYSSGYNNYILDNVMPVKDCPNWPLNGQTQEERKTLATNLGNVILIHKDKGLASRVKTESFINKKRIIEEDVREVEVSKNILNPQVWTENMILTRANWLAEKIKNVWRV